MSIEYDLFANPPQEGQEKPTLHARAINTETVHTDELAKMIEGMSTFTAADIKGAIKAIGDRMFYYLSNSQSVHLEGIGTFSVTLKCRPVENKKDIRAASISFKNVEFRADPEMKNRFRGVRIERREGTSEKKVYTDDIRQKRNLMVYQKLWDDQSDRSCQHESLYAPENQERPGTVDSRTTRYKRAGAESGRSTSGGRPTRKLLKRRPTIQ